MNAPARANMQWALSAEHRKQLMRIAREVSFPQGTRLFVEGRHADRFWTVRTGTVDLDIRVPGRPPAVIESLGHDALVGWSWMFPPYVWRLGAEAATRVCAYEFDAATVRTMCQADQALGVSVAEWVGGVVAHRLHTTRTRLLDLYAPYGSGGLR